MYQLCKYLLGCIASLLRQSYETEEQCQVKTCILTFECIHVLTDDMTLAVLLRPRQPQLSRLAHRLSAGGARDLVVAGINTTRAISRDTAPTTQTLTPTTTSFRPSQLAAKMSEYIG